MINRICKWLVFKIIYPIWYHIGTLRKVQKNKVIFVENHSEKLSDNYILLYEQLERKGYEITIHYLMVSTFGWGRIIIRTLQMIRDMSTAACIFVNESNSVFGSFALRKETKLVQLWHACGAFKKWGYSVTDKSFGDNRTELDRYKPHRNYSLVPVSGKEVCFAYEEAFGLIEHSDVVKPLGVSRTDVFFENHAREQALCKLRGAGISFDGKQIILYAPTFRGDIKGATYPNAFDVDLLYERLKDDFIILIKNHPFIKEKIEFSREYSDFIMDVSDQFSIEDLLLAADICITDYSSIVFEYSLLKRPILFFAYDLEEYYEERGFYYPYEEFVPGPILKTTEEIVDYIAHIEQYDLDKVVTFKNQYMDGCDGHATKRILEHIFDDTFQ